MNTPPPLPPAPPEDAPAQSLRICPACTQEISVPFSQKSMIVKCPQCDADVDPEDRVASEAELTRTRTLHGTAVAGFIASLFLHTLLLCTFMFVTWRAHSRSDAEEGIEVGVVSTDDTSALVRSEVAPIRYEGQWADLSPMTPGGMSALEALGDPETLAPALQSGSIVGMEMAAGGVSGLEGDFAGLGTLGGGAGGSAKFFGLVARGRKFIYVVDRSSSMRGPRFEDAKRELVRSIRNLPRFAEYYVYFYDTVYVGMGTDGMIRATPENKRGTIDWIATIESQGGTDPSGALISALKLEPDAIWLLSDGVFSPRALRALREHNAEERVQVHTIAFHDDSGRELLETIAKENDGRFRFVRSRDAVRTRIHR